MLDMNKIHNTTDIIHGTIQISCIENLIISSPLYNRMHKILQSSLLYRTFTSNRVKRYEHGIGTMHLAGQMFFYSVVNADDSVLKVFFEQINSIIKDLQEKGEFNNWDNNIPQELFDDKGSDLPCYANPTKIKYESTNFFNQYLPPNVGSGNHFAYLVIFQAIRIAALLHDIGHLPYSHVTEKALENLYRSIKNNGDYDNGNYKGFIKNTELYFDSTNVKRKELHEELSLGITNVIFDSIKNLFVEEDINIALVPPIFRFVNDILSSKIGGNTIFSDLHDIISGNLDADRLDYCCRDLFCAGVQKDIINYERLFNSYKMICIEKDCGRKAFYFAPSIKMLQLVESILYRRWRIYVDLNFHHDVHKSELLMVKAITEIGIDVLSDVINEEKKEMLEELPFEIGSFIRFIIRILAKTNFKEKQSFLLIQMNDEWFDITLNKYFIEKYKPHPFLRKLHKSKVLWNVIYELISAQKLYKSVINRYDDFKVFDEMFLRSLQKQFERRLCVGTELSNSDIIKFIGYVKTGKTEKIKRIFWIDSAFGIVEEANDKKRHTNECKKIIECEAPNKIKKLYDNYRKGEVIDIILGFFDLKNGYNFFNPLRLYKKDGSTENFENSSDLFNRLQSEKNYAPTFHLYICPNNEYDREKLLIFTAEVVSEFVTDALLKTIEYYK